MDANNFHMWYIQVHGQNIRVKESKQWSTTSWIGQLAGHPFKQVKSFTSYANLRIMVF